MCDSDDFIVPSKKRTYLITYSQADEERYPMKESFAEVVVEAFKSVGQGNGTIVYYAVAKESHKDGNVHYHMSIKLSTPQSWKPIKMMITLTIS